MPDDLPRRGAAATDAPAVDAAVAPRTDEPPTNEPPINEPRSDASPGDGSPADQPPAHQPATDQPAIPLRANRDFKVFFIGQGISAVGDAVTFTTLPLLVLALTGSGVLMGAVGVLAQLPDLILGLPVGALADRFDRRRLMLLADAGRAALVALIPLSTLLGLDTMTVVLLVTFPVNACRVLFMAGWTAGVPSLVGRPMLGRAISLFEAVLSLSFIVGPALAGILVGLIGPAQTLAIDAVSFALSALSLTLIRRPLRTPNTGERKHLVGEIREGVDFIRHHGGLRVALAFWTSYSIVTGGLIASLTYYMRIDRGLDPSWLGIVLSAFGVGHLVGALSAGRLTSGRLAPMLLGGGLVQGLVLLGITTPVHPIVICGGAFVAGIGGAMLFVGYITFRSSVTPDRLLGRVGSTARTISIGLIPIGTFTAGVLLDQIAGTATLRVMAFAMLAVTVAFAFSATLRSARVQSRPTDSAAAAVRA